MCIYIIQNKSQYLREQYRGKQIRLLGFGFQTIWVSNKKIYLKRPKIQISNNIWSNIALNNQTYRAHVLMSLTDIRQLKTNLNHTHSKGKISNEISNVSPRQQCFLCFFFWEQKKRESKKYFFLSHVSSIYCRVIKEITQPRLAKMPMSSKISKGIQHISVQILQRPNNLSYNIHISFSVFWLHASILFHCRRNIWHKVDTWINHNRELHYVS